MYHIVEVPKDDNSIATPTEESEDNYNDPNDLDVQEIRWEQKQDSLIYKTSLKNKSN